MTQPDQPVDPGVDDSQEFLINEPDAASVALGASEGLIRAAFVLKKQERMTRADLQAALTELEQREV